MLLTGPGDRKTEALRAIRTITGLSLWDSKLLLDSAPVAITEPDLARSRPERGRCP
ncbi:MULTISPECIES: ribosomal protein L7/L12 [Streptomyces]|uniref:ribosomal protein L7/L12 n=1 Tax=Streptomyces sp. CC71 TaxID=1770211 RepID=UPI002092431A|nr:MULTISPECIES: ribosomal protein L7/L12 [Streptomyces]